MSLDYGAGSNDYYGIPRSFTMPDLTAVTMRAWVKHDSSHLQRRHFSYYLSYKKNTSGTEKYDLLAFYTGGGESGERGESGGSGGSGGSAVSELTASEQPVHSIVFSQ